MVADSMNEAVITAVFVLLVTMSFFVLLIIFGKE